MTTEFWRTKRVKIRKPHSCEGCLSKHEPGEELEYNAGMFDGEMQSYYLCDDCREFIDNDEGWNSDEGFSPGDIGEWRREAEAEDD